MDSSLEVRANFSWPLGRKGAHGSCQLSLCGQSPPQLTLKKSQISAWIAVFEATPPLAGRRSGHKGANLPVVYPSTLGHQGPLQRPGGSL